MKTVSLMLVFLLTPFNFGATVPVNKSVQRMVEASVLLRIKHVDRENPKKSGVYGCSGTFISPRLIITAAHCVAGDVPSMTVWARGVRDTTGYPCQLVARERSLDLALLRTPFPHPYVKLGKMPKRGDKVLNIGSPMSFEFVPSEGIVGMTDFQMEEYAARYLVTTAMANPGSSGGGAFDHSGRLIGVNTMIVGIFGWTGITLSVNTDTIRRFIADMRERWPMDEE